MKLAKIFPLIFLIVLAISFLSFVQEMNPDDAKLNNDDNSVYFSIDQYYSASEYFEIFLTSSNNASVTKKVQENLLLA